MERGDHEKSCSAGMTPTPPSHALPSWTRMVQHVRVVWETEVRFVLAGIRSRRRLIAAVVFT